MKPGGRPDRNAILTEMGLSPIWTLRRQESLADSASAETRADEAGTAGASSEGAPALRTEAVHGPGPSASPSLAEAPAGIQDSKREALIRRMDWPALREAVSGCQACALHASRNRTVFGVGDERAQWMLVGEAPGAEEDRLGEPFVGQAGKLLDGMLASIALKRGDNVYIANVLKCRPPGNRNPEPEEVARCAPHLARQVELIGPKVILGLGRFAAHTLLNSDASIASLRGKVHRYGGVPLVITYHPAYLLRSLSDKAKAWEDLLLARRVFRESVGN